MTRNVIVVSTMQLYHKFVTIALDEKSSNLWTVCVLVKVFVRELHQLPELLRIRFS